MRSWEYLCSRFKFRVCLYAPEDVLIERGDGGKGRESPTAGAMEPGPRAGREGLEATGAQER